jgi:hypothetical protein
LLFSDRRLPEKLFRNTVFGSFDRAQGCLATNGVV